MKHIEYKEKKSLVDQLRHVDATPLILNNLEDVVVGAVRHLFEQHERVVRSFEVLEEENKALRLLCKQNGIAVPRKSKI